MRDILFVGDILASVTHEMQNVMAIIKESGALADDILHLNGPPRMKHGDKLAVALTNIQEQVGRGRNLMLMLNGFAHAAADYPESSDLTRFCKQICVLAERMVRLKECTLDAQCASAPVPVRGNALMLMQTVYLGLAAALEGCAAGDALRLRVAGTDAGGSVLIKAAKGTQTPDIQSLAPLMAELGGTCRAEAGALELAYAPALSPLRQASA